MKIVVTGGAGFIGSHVVDSLLASGHDVTVMDDFSSGRNENLGLAFASAHDKGLKFRVLRASISEPETWKELPAHDALFHFAAQTSVTASVFDPERDFRLNVESVRHICDWVRAHKVRFVLYANTAGALYGNAQMCPTDERQLLRPECPYGATKAFFETYYQSLAQSLRANGFWSDKPSDANYNSWVSFRLGNIYGPRQVSKGESGVVPIFMEALGRGETPTIFGNGSKTRDYVHVSDVARAFILAFEKMQVAVLNETFNVGTGIETRDLEVFQHVLKAMHEMGSDPASPAPYGQALNVSQPKFGPIRAGEIEKSQLSFSKIEAFLGWRPEHSFYEGIRSTVKTFFTA